MLGALKGIMKNKGLVVPTVMYGSVMGYESNQEKLNVFE